MGSSVSRRRRVVAASIWIAAALLVLAVAYQRLGAPQRHTPAQTEASSRRAKSAGDRAIEDALDARRSGIWVESSGTVERVLTDDRQGSRHQRFVVRLRDGHSLLFAHNIDLAPRVPVEPGSAIRFRGVYEWSARGGTVHWTHHDPNRGQAGGWIELGGRQFR